MNGQKEGLEALCARLSDLCRKAEGGELAVSPFLSPRELYFARQYLQKTGALFFCFGGYEGAERGRVYCLPEYMEEVRDPEDLSLFGYSHRIQTVEVRGSGYCALSHRDFLGALLGLGLERSVIGDLCVVSEEASTAYVWLEESIQPFVLSELKSVGRDTVKVQSISLPPKFTPAGRVIPIHDTVASSRLDGVVASLCSLSRERAREAVTKGLVELNYETEERGDRAVCPPAVISVRGYGKFRVLSVSEQTKKGRLRLVAEKYR